MSIKVLWTLIALALANVAYGADRWSSFAEDTDQNYYLDQKSVITLGDNGYLFWIKSVPKDKEYIRREYNMTSLSYILTNYELDCSAGRFRVRGTIMFDKNRKELAKTVPAGEALFEPIPPESIVEVAQETLCVAKGKSAQEKAAPAAKTPPPAPEPPAEEPSLQ